MDYDYLTEICQLKQWKTVPNKELTKNGFPVYGANGVIGYYSEYNQKQQQYEGLEKLAAVGAVHAVRRMLIRIPDDVRRDRQYSRGVCRNTDKGCRSDARLRLSPLQAHEEVGARGQNQDVIWRM